MSGPFTPLEIALIWVNEIMRFLDDYGQWGKKLKVFLSLTGFSAFRKWTFGCVLILIAVSFLTVGFFSGNPKTFPIQMKVDFGPAGKPVHEEKLYVEKGTTPKEAVSQVFPVLSGKACCSFREVIEIGGVRVDPEKKLWWICKLNGSKNVSPQKKKLKTGDIVEWKYIQDDHINGGTYRS